METDEQLERIQRCEAAVSNLQAQLYGSDSELENPGILLDLARELRQLANLLRDRAGRRIDLLQKQLCQDEGALR